MNTNSEMTAMWLYSGGLCRKSGFFQHRSSIKYKLAASVLNTVLLLMFGIGPTTHSQPDTSGEANRYAESGQRKIRNIAGWTVHISAALMATNAQATDGALELLTKQLEEIRNVVPKAAVLELQKVPLWISPEYPGVKPRAEYHPGAGWLREHGRDPAMAKGVEFTNVRIFEAETRRMPNFALHELAHAYQDRVLSNANAELKAAYQHAKAGGKYERVQRRDSQGKETIERAYAMVNVQEYFAESTEAFFSTNDFFPFTRADLGKHDPDMAALLAKIWGVVPVKAAKLPEHR